MFLNTFLSLLILTLPLQGSLTACRAKLVENVCQNHVPVSQALAEYNAALQEKIAALFKESIGGLSSGPWALFCFGSTSQYVATPSSDLEFGILVSEDTPEARRVLAEAVKNFHEKVLKEEIVFDHRGWHPCFLEGREEIGVRWLVSTPLELARVRADKRSVRRAYALFNPLFLGGSKDLFAEFEQECEKYPYPSKEIIQEELIKTDRSLGATIQLLTFLNGVYKKRSAGIDDALCRDAVFPIKPRWIKPLLEMVQYLCMKHKIKSRTPYEALHILAEKQVVSGETRDSIRRILDHSLAWRIFYGDTVPIAKITTEELGEFLRSFSFYSWFFSYARKEAASLSR